MSEVARLHTPIFLALAALAGGVWLVLGLDAGGAGAVFVLGAFVLALGLPHGALDLWVAARQDRWGRGGRFTRGGVLRFHAEYLALAALVVAAFYAVPTIALIGFLLLSLWHFADDWRSLPTPVRLGCASVIVIVPTLFHGAEVAAIFADVTGRAPPQAVEAPYVFWLVSSWIVGGSIVLAVLMDRRAGAEVAALAALAAALPPLVFFALYFTLLHGPRHLIRHGALALGSRARLVLAAYTIAAFGIVAAVGLILSRSDDLGLAADATRAVFAGLAALTVPHAILMEADKRTRARDLGRQVESKPCPQ